MERHIRVLIGCNESAVVDAVRILLTATAQNGRTYRFTASSRSDEFIEQARSGEFDLAIMHTNCLSPTQPFTPLENALYAVQHIKTSVPLKLIAITTMDEWVAPLRASGADVCLKAPIAVDQLLAAVTTRFEFRPPIHPLAEGNSG
ncbi:MAG: hypothetical protein KJ070_22440 [Verrucomicrobia bacterium]|nr:hypothetical protein [Verrucomicrobiota bacterium]